MNPAHNDAAIQLRNERKLISVIEATIKKNSKSRAIALAYTAIQLAFMWMGKALQALDQPNPYPASRDASSKVIEPTADQEAEMEIPEYDDNVQFCKATRSELDVVVKAIANDRLILKTLPDYQDAVANAHKHAIEAQMWLGQELREIRDAAPVKAEKAPKGKKGKAAKVVALPPAPETAGAASTGTVEGVSVTLTPAPAKESGKKKSSTKKTPVKSGKKAATSGASASK